MGERQSTVEGLEMTVFGDVYRNRRVLLTGHTGFKGSWLALWLKTLRAEITGVALAPGTRPAHWDLLGLELDDRRIDVRDTQALADVVHGVAPEIVFHLAAQSLVRRSYRDPLETWSTNVMGAANLLEACRQQSSVRAIVVITSDKCYENGENACNFKETDRLGGHDPYSASKASAELVAASYRNAFFAGEGGPLLATARAGNVIGGGDWSQDRLIPDLVRAADKGESLEIRSPRATRPWQHVLEPLSGYLLLGQALLEGRSELTGAWNFGPDAAGNRTVTQLLEQFGRCWPELSWHLSKGQHPHEAALLQLDSAKAREQLGWAPIWSFEQGVEMTASWYRTFRETGRICSADQLRAYCGERL